MKFYCFRNSCTVSGGATKQLSLADMKAREDQKEPEPLKLVDCIGWEPLTAGQIAREEVYKYLAHNNCLEARNNTPNKFFYDKIKDRVIFVEYYDANSFKLATGRSLRGEVPKWYKYVSLPGAYFLQRCKDPSDTMYIVEDCASACSVARIGHGLALCGTSYDTHSILVKAVTNGCNNIVVCLDADAQLKALQLKLDLQGLGKMHSVTIAQVSDDLKYMELNKLKKELNYGKEESSSS